MRAAVIGFLFCILLIRYPAVMNMLAGCSVVCLGGFLRCTGLLAFKMECFIRFHSKELIG